MCVSDCAADQIASICSGGVCQHLNADPVALALKALPSKRTGKSTMSPFRGPTCLRRICSYITDELPCHIRSVLQIWQVFRGFLAVMKLKRFHTLDHLECNGTAMALWYEVCFVYLHFRSEMRKGKEMAHSVATFTVSYGETTFTSAQQGEKPGG